MIIKVSNTSEFEIMYKFDQISTWWSTNYLSFNKHQRNDVNVNKISNLRKKFKKNY